MKPVVGDCEHCVFGRMNTICLNQMKSVVTLTATAEQAPTHAQRTTIQASTVLKKTQRAVAHQFLMIFE